MLPQFTTGVFNQKRWPRAGDTDDCWVLADLMAIHSVAPWLRLPDVTKYRAAAGVPDLPGPTPGNVTDSFKAIKKLYPRLGALVGLRVGSSFANVLEDIQAGHPASISLLSGSLPKRLQFGFVGNHRVAVFWTGTELRLANPLARAHSRTKPISNDELHKAVKDHPDLAATHCVLMPTVEEAFALHPLLGGAIDDAIAGLDDGADDTDGMEDVPAA